MLSKPKTLLTYVVVRQLIYISVCSGSSDNKELTVTKFLYILNYLHYIYISLRFGLFRSFIYIVVDLLILNME